MKKALVIALVLVFTVGMVFANGSSESSAPKQRTLTIWYEGNEAESFNRLIPEFEAAHPDIKIELVNIPYASLSIRSSSLVSPTLAQTSCGSPTLG